VELRVDRGDVQLLDGTRLLAEELHLDPLGLIGSGALLVGCALEAAGNLAAAYAERGIPFAWIGRARRGAALTVHDPPCRASPATRSSG